MLVLLVLVGLASGGTYVYLEVPASVRVQTLANGNTITSPLDWNGKVHGVVLERYPDGKLCQRSIFRRDVEVSHVSYWPDGNLRSEMYEGSNYQQVYKSYPAVIYMKGDPAQENAAKIIPPPTKPTVYE